MTFKTKRKAFEAELNTILFVPPIKEVRFGTLSTNLEFPFINIQLANRTIGEKKRIPSGIATVWVLEYDIYIFYQSINDLITDTQDYIDDVVDIILNENQNGRFFNNTTCYVELYKIELGLLAIATQPNSDPLYSYGGRVILRIGIPTTGSK
jgi:hypothetical protein